MKYPYRLNSCRSLAWVSGLQETYTIRFGFAVQTLLMKTGVLPLLGGSMTTTSSFEKMRATGAVLIDKTALIYRMVSGANDAFYLHRPRRFGKSLLVSMLQAYFEGRKELFDGLAIADLEKDWIKYPVFKFDMSNMKDDTLRKLDENLDSMLRDYEKIYGRDPEDTLPGTRLKSLIKKAREKTGQRAVVLIDEYDTPILDCMMDDQKTLNTIRNKLWDFYGAR